MRRRNDNIRKIQQSGKRGSYRLTIPVQLMRELKWREHQKVILNRSGRKIIITDWPGKK